MLTAALHPTPMMFTFRLKAVLASVAPAAAPAPASPAGAAVEAPTTPSPAKPPLSSVVVTVKVGATPPVAANIIPVTPMMLFAALRTLALADRSSTELSRLKALPVKVLTYSGPQHLSTQLATASLSAIVTQSIALGYRHVVFEIAAPAEQPAARPTANAFERVAGARRRSASADALCELGVGRTRWRVGRAAATVTSVMSVTTPALQIHRFTDLTPSLPLSLASPFTRTRESSYRRWSESESESHFSATCF